MRQDPRNDLTSTRQKAVSNFGFHQFFHSSPKQSLCSCLLRPCPLVYPYLGSSYTFSHQTWVMHITLGWLSHRVYLSHLGCCRLKTLFPGLPSLYAKWFIHILVSPGAKPCPPHHHNCPHNALSPNCIVSTVYCLYTELRCMATLSHSEPHWFGLP